MGKVINNKNESKKKQRKSPIFLIALFNFLIIIFMAIYIIYLRFIPYKVITYDGYAISGKQIVNNLLDTSFEVEESVDALEVKDQDGIYQNLKSFYVGEDKKKNINLNYPIYVNDTLALFNLSSDVMLYTEDFQKIKGYSGFTLTAGALYNSNTLERADYHNYIIMKNSDNLYMNTKEITVETVLNKYTIKINSIMNITDEFITYYTLEDGKFVYGKILDLDFSSKVKIKDYDRKYTYEEFLIGLEIIKPEEKEVEEKEENEVIEEEKQEENILNDDDKQENTIENSVENTLGDGEVNNEIIEDSNGEVEPDTTPTKWQKPEVSCTDFQVNTYTATTNINISDPSGAINKAITYTFYNNGEIEFRVSATSSGILKVTKLKPSTKYQVIGTYQYTNEKGRIIEVEFYKQEITTLGTNNIKPIELTLKNGQIYPNKIEIIDLGITSDITDEAIDGVSRAEVEINNSRYPVSTKILRNILNGEKEIYQSLQLEPNTKYKYEIKFYDVAENEMKLNNNTGATITSKAEPSVRIRDINNITSIKLKLTLSNKDDVKINNYRYVLYSETGEIVKKEGLSEKTEYLNFEDLKADTLYTIKIYADFDIEDGNGLIENREIGNYTFITSSLDKLGRLKLKLDYDEKKGITDNSIDFNAKIDLIKTNEKLIKILDEIKIDIVEKNSDTSVKTFYNKEISSLISDDGVDYRVENLRSNTEYEIVITATAKQGNEIKNIKTTYTLTSFTTNKKKANFYIINDVVTANMIDLKVMVEDADGASLDGKYVIELREWNKNTKEEGILIRKDEINANDIYKEMTYENLEKGNSYILICYAKQYNEKNNKNNILKNYEIGRKAYETTGLEGDIELIGLNREIYNSRNLIDVESNNKWYSQCFDVLQTSYENEQFKTVSLRKYGKKYENGTLTLIPNQNYVYNLLEYKGKKVTMSFKATMRSGTQVYIQEGKKTKEDKSNIINIGELNKEGQYYVYTCNVPDDGYLGFYLEGTSSIAINELQVEEGEKRTSYTSYEFELKSNIEVSFIDEKKVTYQDGGCKYWIRIIKNGDEQNPIVRERFDEDSNNRKSYTIDKTELDTNYEIQLFIVLYGKEYILDTVSFKYDADYYKEITSISNVEEFLDIQPDGNYRILKDIDLTNATTQSEYTFGNPDIPFNGNIDFNGKTITKDIYNKKQGKCTSYIFYNISKTASINNIVLDFKINTIEKLYEISIEDGLYSLFLYNNGTIDNVMINLTECSKQDQRYIGLLGYNNTGKINNFVIDLKTILYCSQYTSGLCLYSSGIIQNGYMFGENIEAISYTTINDSRHIAGVVYKVEQNGLMQNIYNLSGITINHVEESNRKGFSYAANIVYEVAKNAQVRNIYSIKEYKVKYKNREYSYLLNNNDKEQQLGPNVLTSSGNVKESYYFTGLEYQNNNTNKKQEQTVLLDKVFQDYLLNANDQNQFLIEGYVEEEIYPQLKLNECMPDQIRNPIEIDDGNNVIDILSAEIIEYEDIDAEDKKNIEIPDNIDINDENVKIAFFKIYNSFGLEVSNINIDYLQNDILYQNKEETITKLYAVIHTPTTCIEDYNYNISSVSCQNSWGNVYTVEYTGDRKVTLKATFVKYITNESDWDNIDSLDGNGVSGLIQNYKLATDLDFDNCEYSPAISETFSGTIDGQNYKISNITIKVPLFGRLTSTIKNLNVENYTVANSTSRGMGLIGVADDGSVINNVHIKNANLWTSYQGYDDARIGGICGVLENATIKNSSVSGLNIESKDNQKIYIIGGIVGLANGYTITKNCYVNGLEIKTEQNTINGIGGIIGRGNGSGAGTIIEYCYSNGSIITDSQYTGGIFGQVGSVANIRNCWSLVNITCNMTTGSVYVGGIGGYHPREDRTNNNVYFGNTYVVNETVENSKRIVGNYTNNNRNNYGYENQIINGLKTTDNLGAKGLISPKEVYNKDTYLNKALLGDEEYVYAQNGEKYLPKLKNADTNELLPNQADIMIAEQLKIIYVKVSDASDEDKNTAGVDLTAQAAKIEIRIENTDNYIITNADIENMTIKGGISQFDYEQSEVIDVLTFVVVPEKYYDTYDIISFRYKKDDLSDEDILYSSVKINKTFYKTIANLDEWNRLITNDCENYKLIGDIYIGNNDIITNKKIGKLISDETHVISGKSSVNGNEIKELNAPLIEKITTRFNNIRFENFKVNYSGLIEESNAKTDNCTFSNITINALNKNNVGVIASCSIGCSMSNINIDHITVQGNSYVGGLCGYVNSSRDFVNITGTYITVNAQDKKVGGIFGYIVGGAQVNTIKAYQYSEQGIEDGEKETEFLVSGKGEIGGCIGYSNSYINIAETKYSKILAGNGSNVGGCIGYTDRDAYDVSSSHNEITGGRYVGGCIGNGRALNEVIKSNNNSIISSDDYLGGCIGYASSIKEATSTYNVISWTEENQTKGRYVGGCVGLNTFNADILNSQNNLIKGNNEVGGCIGRIEHRSVSDIVSINNDIEAKGNNIGGCIGYIPLNSENIRSLNNKINSTGNNVGGCIGYTKGRIVNAKTEYDNNYSEVIKIQGNNSIGGIVGKNEYTNLGLAITSSSINGAYVNNATIKGTGNVGGIAGYQNGSLYSVGVNNSNIIAQNENNTASCVGGLVGFYKSSESTTNPSHYNENAPFYLKHSFCTNSNIQADQNVGGLIGQYMYGNIQYCYVGNTNITALSSNAGGFIGYLDNQKANDKQYIPKMSYSFIASNDPSKRVISPKCAGGIIGSVYTDIMEDCFKNILVVTDVISTGSDYVSPEIGMITLSGENGDAQSENMDAIYVYNNSIITGQTINGTFGSLLESNDNYKYTVQTSSQLSDVNTYTDSNILNFDGSSENDKRYIFEQGYFPILASLNAFSTQTYWGESYLNITQDKIAIPTENSNSLVSNQNLYSLSTLSLSTDDELPEVYTYAVGVDKINIEFSYTDPYTYFEVRKDDDISIIEKTEVLDRVYTLEYDFNTPLKITVSNLQNWYTEEVEPNDVRNLLDIVNDEYMYLAENTLYSNKREITGEFVNVYKGKALATNGDVYDTSNMSVINKLENKFKLLDEQVPISESKYNDIDVETYYHCSKVAQNDGTYSYKNQQIFIKNGDIYLIDGNMKNIGNAVIIDSYNNNQYETTLGTDGVLYDLLTEIKYPVNFKNEDIIAMTNNVDNNNNIILVYYSTGKVIGFNYITGEQVYDNNVNNEEQNLISYMLDSLNFDEALYEMEEQSYDDAKVLSEKLESVSIEEALEEIENDGEKEETSIDEKEEANKEYITTYNSKTQSYDVYSSSEIFGANITPMESENEKINKDSELISYYTNMSTSKMNLKSIGMIILVVTISSICIILIAMYKKNYKENR